MTTQRLVADPHDFCDLIVRQADASHERDLLARFFVRLVWSDHGFTLSVKRL
jgi:hypothetical protein